MESKLSMYGDKVNLKENSATEMTQKNKQLKRELLSHAFNLGYGKNTHKRGPSMDVIQHMKQHGLPMNQSTTLKKKNEKQNFKYQEDIGSRVGKTNNSFSHGHGSRYAPGHGNGKLPMDYWKTNFAFNQVEKKTETGSLHNSMIDQYGPTAKSSMGTTRSGFSEISGLCKQQNDKNILQRNKAKAIKSSFTVGYSKGEFNTSYNNQFLWKVPKVDV